MHLAHARGRCGWQVTPEMRVDDAEFEENEVYAIDIVVRLRSPLAGPQHVATQTAAS